jgi:hypothetical protein
MSSEQKEKKYYFQLRSEPDENGVTRLYCQQEVPKAMYEQLPKYFLALKEKLAQEGIDIIMDPTHETIMEGKNRAG